MCRHNRLKGTLPDAAPILWQYGALARLKKGEAIDKLLYDGYSTLSLGYAGRRIDLPGDSYGCYLEALPLEKADILKVPHHACKNAVSEAYLQKLCPTYAVVSVSDNYQKAVRPHEESVQLLERYAEKLLFTDAVGTKKHPPRLHSVVRLCIEPDGRICYNETV